MAVKKGDIVTLDYEGTLEDGNVFDSSQHDGHSHPLTFEAGSGQVIAGFDSAVMGMEVGQEKTFTIQPQEAYGNYEEKAVQKVPRNMLPKEIEPKEGMQLMVGTPDGHAMPVRIAKVDNESVTLDLNHPLAGKALTFKIKLLAIGEEDAKKFQHQH